MVQSRSVILWALAICCPFYAQSQILRVDKNHLESDSAGYRTLTADINYSLDNRSVSATEKLVYSRLSSRVDMLYVTKKQAFILVNSIEYFKGSNSTPFSTGYAHFRINFRRQHPVSLETYAQIQYDGVRRMRLRNLLGGGFRFTVADKENVDIHMGTGLMYERETWRETEGDPASDFHKALLKTSSYVGLELNLADHSQFTLWGLHQMGYDQAEAIFRNRYAGEAVLSFHITKRLTWINRFSYFYDVRPVIPINQAYFQLVNGLRIQL
jgi:hypothetical protein